MKTKNKGNPSRGVEEEKGVGTRSRRQRSSWEAGAEAGRSKCDGERRGKSKGRSRRGRAARTGPGSRVVGTRAKATGSSRSRCRQAE